MTQADSKKAAADKAAANIILKFSSPYKRYAGGDIAGFEPKVANKILALKPAVAEEYKPEE
ncbi:hypothetical protein [Pseudoalteromonas rhizosphaerae]|uniref:hypothetical protein n=1 Tax=Pseudoalteromonas rhizosphaerae TaxID=2518973 RepID=UPI00384A8F72